MTLLKKGALALIAALLCAACTKPTEGIKIVVDTNVIKYTALIHITDAANGGNPPAGVSLAVTGQDADQIYEISGKKNFTVAGGIISVGPTPALVPTADRPVKFNIVVTAPGYTTVIQPVQISPGQAQQVISVSMAKTNMAGGGVTVTPATPVTATPGAAAVTLTFVGTCANKDDFELHPSNYIFYRVHGALTGYQYLGYMDKGQITASLLMGTTYDFEMNYNGVNYTVTQKIDQTSYSETIDMGTDVCSNF